jgi:hypothetical protein
MIRMISTSTVCIFHTTPLLLFFGSSLSLLQDYFLSPQPRKVEGALRVPVLTRDFLMVKNILILKVPKDGVYDARPDAMLTRLHHLLEHRVAVHLEHNLPRIGRRIVPFHGQDLLIVCRAATTYINFAPRHQGTGK